MNWFIKCYRLLNHLWYGIWTGFWTGFRSDIWTGFWSSFRSDIWTGFRTSLRYDIWTGFWSGLWPSNWSRPCGEAVFDILFWTGSCSVYVCVSSGLTEELIYCNVFCFPNCFWFGCVCFMNLISVFCARQVWSPRSRFVCTVVWDRVSEQFCGISVTNKLSFWAHKLYCNWTGFCCGVSFSFWTKW